MNVVRSELTVRVAALAASLNLPVAYENNPFTKPVNTGPYLEMYLIPATTVDVSTDATRQRELGIMQINIWSKTGVGTKLGEDIAEAVINAFRVIPKVGLVSIESTPSVKQAILDPSGYRIIPVIIPYRYESQS